MLVCYNERACAVSQNVVPKSLANLVLINIKTTSTPVGWVCWHGLSRLWDVLLKSMGSMVDTIPWPPRLMIKAFT